MKPIICLLFSVIVFTSCNFFLKEEKKGEASISDVKNVKIGSELDDNGCAVTAGYRWSVLRTNCIRVFEEGFRLNPINLAIEESEDYTLSCFIVFNSDKDIAELFFPDEKESVLLEYKKEDKFFSNDIWKLIISDKADWRLKKNNKLLYTSPKAIDMQIIDSDELEDL